MYQNARGRCGGEVWRGRCAWAGLDRCHLMRCKLAPSLNPLNRTEMLFAAFFAVTFLKRKLNRLHLMGLLCCLAGITLVGSSSLLSGEGSSTQVRGGVHLPAWPASHWSAAPACCQGRAAPHR